MAFGGVAVDALGPTTRFPGRSLLTGLLANALGWDQSAFAAHGALQGRLRYAARLDRCAPSVLTDYQTVDLGQPHLAHDGWTTRGVPEGRRGGPAAKGTHIRQRQYLQDASVVVALTLDPAGEAPTLDDLAAALEAPARPLFLGRKPCLPSAPLLVKDALRDGETLRAILEGVVPDDDADPAPWPALWPLEDGEAEGSRIVSLTDDRDWSTQMHTGSRLMHQGRLPVPIAFVGEDRP